MGEPRTFGMDFGLSSNPAKDDPQGKARRGYSRRHIAFACLALVGLCLFIRRSTAGAVGNDDARSRGDVAFSDLMHPNLEHVPQTGKYAELHGVERLPFKSDDQITPHRPPQEAAAAAKAEKKAAAAAAKAEKKAAAAAKAEKTAAARPAESAANPTQDD